MNILVAHDLYQQRGGEETVASSEVELLKSHGHDVVFYTRDNYEIDSFNKLQKMLLPFTMIFSIRTYKEIKNLIRSKNIELVHVHNTLPLISPSIFYAAKRCGVPVVQTIHNFRMICPNTWFYRDGHICEDCLQKGIRCSLKHKCYRNSFIQTLGVVACNMIHRMTGIYKYVHFICLTDFNRSKLIQLKCIDPDKVYVKPNFYQS